MGRWVVECSRHKFLPELSAVWLCIILFLCMGQLELDYIGDGGKDRRMTGDLVVCNCGALDLEDG